MIGMTLNQAAAFADIRGSRLRARTVVFQASLTHLWTNMAKMMPSKSENSRLPPEAIKLAGLDSQFGSLEND